MVVRKMFYYTFNFFFLLEWISLLQKTHASFKEMVFVHSKREASNMHVFPGLLVLFCSKGSGVYIPYSLSHVFMQDRTPSFF